MNIDKSKTPAMYFWGTPDNYAVKPSSTCNLQKLPGFNIFRRPITNKYPYQVVNLIDVYNYIISNFFQSIGIKANNIRKKERLITDEINSQDPFVALSMTELLESWTRGFDEVNEMYGTDFSVKLNPVLAPTLIESILMDVSESDSEPISEGVVEER